VEAWERKELAQSISVEQKTDADLPNQIEAMG
jgi:hypothetical protein